MSTVELEKVEKKQDDDTPLMFHIELHYGDARALCGKKFRNIDRELFKDLAEIDCVVCAEMWNNLP